jgi:hypothetical protein
MGFLVHVRPCNRGGSLPLGLGGCQPGALAMNKCFPIVVLALVASVAACEYKEQRTVQQPAPATVVATPAPAGSVVYTQPAPATTTVYTTR